MTPEQILQLFEQAEPAPTISEYEREQRALRANYERLYKLTEIREITPSPFARINLPDMLLPLTNLL